MSRQVRRSMGPSQTRATRRTLVANAVHAPLPDAALYTLPEVASILKTSVRHVATLVQSGRISSIKIGRCRRISRIELIRVLASGA